MIRRHVTRERALIGVYLALRWQKDNAQSRNFLLPSCGREYA